MDTGNSKKRLSLAAKFNLLTISLVLATAIGICVFMIRQEISSYYGALLSHGMTIAETTAKNCELGVYTEDHAALSEVLKSLAADADIAYVSIADRRHRELASQVFSGGSDLLKTALPAGEGDRTVMSRHVTDGSDQSEYTEILYPLTGPVGSDVASVLFAGERNAAAPEVIGHLRLGLTHASLQKRIRQLILSTMLFTSLVVLVGTGFTLFLSRRITSPLKRIILVSRHIADGRFDTPVSVRTSDELHDLAEAFDHMRQRLNDYREEVEERIEREKRHLREKDKLLMDLHDGIGGITTNISILTELASKTTDSAGIRKQLDTIAQLSREGVLEIRSFMQSLDSRSLTWSSMAAQIRNQGSSMVDPHHIGFSAFITVADDVREQPGSLLWVNLFRIYKEALMNVIKHAHAETVFVTLQVADEELLLVVEDDGTGLRTGGGGLGRGLLNMQKRAAEIGGHLFIDRREEQGTRVRLHIPFPITYADSPKEL